MRAISLSSLCRFILGLGWGKGIVFPWSESLFFWYIVVLSLLAVGRRSVCNWGYTTLLSVCFVWASFIQHYCAKISRLQSSALGQSMFFWKVCRIVFFSFHYIVFNFLWMNNAFKEFAVMAAQNKLKEHHCVTFSLDSKGLFNI